jgi:hypothetical protein
VAGQRVLLAQRGNHQPRELLGWTLERTVVNGGVLAVTGFQQGLVQAVQGAAVQVEHVLDRQSFIDVGHGLLPAGLLWRGFALDT